MTQNSPQTVIQRLSKSPGYPPAICLGAWTPATESRPSLPWGEVRSVIGVNEAGPTQTFFQTLSYSLIFLFHTFQKCQRFQAWCGLACGHRVGRRIEISLKSTSASPTTGLTIMQALMLTSCG